MPVTEWNLSVWNQQYDWTRQGEEWSEAWGGSEAQWFKVIYPRIHRYLPAGAILEIAPGFGRWTNYLRYCSTQLTIVDLASQCIEACRQRFSTDTHITYHVNDGTSLAMVPDGSIDFVFSFDSLVHVESDVIEIYLAQLAKKLKPNGVGFIHHSNIGEYSKEEFSKENSHMRAFSMTAQRFEALCTQARLQCISQEIVNWGTMRLIDCLSVFTPAGSSCSRANQVIRNADFMSEASHAKRLVPLYMPR